MKEEGKKSEYKKWREAVARRRVMEYLPSVDALQRADYLTIEAFAAAFFMDYDTVRKDPDMPFVLIKGKKYVDVAKFRKMQKLNPVKKSPAEELELDMQDAASKLIAEHYNDLEK